MARLRILAFAESAASAEILRAGLARCDRLHVLGVSADSSGAESSDLGERSDVAVVEVGLAGAGGLSWIDELTALPIPEVAVLADMDRAAEAWDAGARGFVHAGVAGAWQAVIEVVAGGGVGLAQDKVAAIFFMDPEAEALMHSLTAREIEVLRMVANGHTNNEIAHGLGITVSGVKYHLRISSEKLGVQGRWAAVGAAVQLGALTGWRQISGRS